MLASAEAVLARDGLSASMRAIATDAGVGLGTIYRNFPTQEALYQAIIIRRTKALVAEAAELAGAPDPGQAFFGYFTRVVEHAMRTKAIADVLARAGIDPKSGMAGIGEDMRGAVGALLARAQQAGTVRPDLRMPELMAILTATCMAAEHSQWDTQLRARTLAVVFDGMRPQHAPADPGDTAAAGLAGTGGRLPRFSRGEDRRLGAKCLLTHVLSGVGQRAGPAEHGTAPSCVSTGIQHLPSSASPHGRAAPI